MVRGGNPVTDVPGLTPRSPLMIDEPVLVTAEPPRTAKLLAVPRLTGACAPSPSVVQHARVGRTAMIGRAVLHRRLRAACGGRQYVRVLWSIRDSPLAPAR